MRKVITCRFKGTEVREGFFHSVSNNNYHICVIFPRVGNIPELGFF